ncbi:MAG: hypothetical protein GY774_03965 [Planctomycetes bacterium]|nr:hypothetical protein [Planctomycetota bacterium]
MSANPYNTSKYEILSRWRVVKTKPIQTQYKPKQSQFWVNIKGGKAKQTQFKPNNQSSLIINHLEGKANQSQLERSWIKSNNQSSLINNQLKGPPNKGVI